MKIHLINTNQSPINQIRGLKMSKFKSGSIVLSAIWILVLLFAVGCEQQAPTSGLEAPSQGLQFVELEEEGVPFTKLITTTETVTPADGGEIGLEYERGVAKGVQMVFKVEPNSIPDNADITLGLDTKIVGGSVDLSFGPSGLQFNPHAILNLRAHGLNLNNINTESLGFYYVDSNDQLIEMPCDDIIVDKKNGEIKVVNARVPHFSRYAIAFSR